jgi:2-dehydropantoate 2-reductase
MPQCTVMMYSTGMLEPHIAVVGAGANGASIGADLVRAGQDVTLVEQWPAHVDAMRRDGIRVELPTGSHTIPARVLHLCEVAELRETFDIVFMVVKAYDTRWSCELIAPRLSPDGVVVGLQNGMTTGDVASIVGPHRSLGAVIEIAANMFVPGVVERQTPPEGTWFNLGSPDGSAADRVEEVATVLRAAGRVDLTDDIGSGKWMKLVGNAAEFLPSAILDQTLVDALHIPGIRELADAAGREALAVGLARGHRIVPLFGSPGLEEHGPETYSAAVLDAILDGWSLPDTRVALLQDWVKGRRGEGEDINGLVVSEGARLAVATPVNEVLVNFSRRIESGTLERALVNVEPLIAAARDARAVRA